MTESYERWARSPVAEPPTPPSDRAGKALSAFLWFAAAVVLTAALLLSGCKEPGPPAEWRGLDGSKATCVWPQDHNGNQTGPGTCVAEGHAFLCVFNVRANVVACAPAGAPLPAEEAGK